MFKALFTNWQPTLAGVIVFLGMLFGELAKDWDDNPDTHTSWDTIVKVIMVGGGAVGLGATSRQWNVTSEQVEAKPEKKHH